MRFRGILLVFLLAFYTGAALADSRCPPLTKSPIVNIKNSPARVIYKTGYSSKDLERLQRARGRHATSGNWRILGLTLTDFRYALKTSVQLTAIPGGRYCAEPVSFELDISYKDFLVYIDRKYPPGSCEYKAIPDHENYHVRLYRGYLSRYLPTIRQQARHAAATVPPVVVSSPDRGAQYIQNQMQRRIKPLIDRLNRDANISNAKIDTPKSYRNIRLLCGNW